MSVASDGRPKGASANSTCSAYFGGAELWSQLERAKTAAIIVIVPSNSRVEYRKPGALSTDSCKQRAQRRFNLPANRVPSEMASVVATKGNNNCNWLTLLARIDYPTVVTKAKAEKPLTTNSRVLVFLAALRFLRNVPRYC